MTMIDDRDVQKWDGERLGKELVELNDLAEEALREAESLEIKAKSLRCDADKYQRKAAEIMRFRCPQLGLEQPR